MHHNESPSRSTTTASGSPISKDHTPKPPLLENEINHGLITQQNWQEKPELSLLSSLVLKFGRLSPFDDEEIWQSSLKDFDSVINSLRFKTSRKITTLRSRNLDLNSLKNEKIQLFNSIENKRKEIEIAKGKLVKAKYDRKNREDYERMAKDITKRPSLGDIEKALIQETELKTKADRQSEQVEARLDYCRLKSIEILRLVEELREDSTKSTQNILQNV